MTIVKHLVISGRVQGVGFRFHTERVAQELGVTGWVRNRRDGSVEAIVQGPADAVESLRRWAASGPPSAQVTAVDAAPAEGDFAAFEMRPTA